MELNKSGSIFLGGTDFSGPNHNGHVAGHADLSTNDQFHSAEVLPRSLHEADEEEEKLSAAQIGNVIGAAIVIIAVGLCGVFLPILIKKIPSLQTVQEKVEMLLNAFAAGGFWGLAILHVLFEAIAACEAGAIGIEFASGGFYNAAYPLSILGYFVMLAIESLVATMVQAKAQASAQGEYGRQKFALFDAVIATAALTFHSFFEGMIVGLREGRMVWITAVAVIGHKWAAAFALSTRLSHHDTPRIAKWIALSVFVLASPIGALCGLPLSSAPSDSAGVAIINCLTAGLLIYIAAETTAEVFRCSLHSHTHTQHCDSQMEKLETQHHQHYSPSLTESLEAHSHCAHTEQAMVPSIKPSERTSSGKIILIFLTKLVVFLGGLGLIFGMMCLHLTDPGEGHEHTRWIRPSEDAST